MNYIEKLSIWYSKNKCQDIIFNEIIHRVTESLIKKEKCYAALHPLEDILGFSFKKRYLKACKLGFEKEIDVWYQDKIKEIAKEFCLSTGFFLCHSCFDTLEGTICTLNNTNVHCSKICIYVMLHCSDCNNLNDIKNLYDNLNEDDKEEFLSHIKQKYVKQTNEKGKRRKLDF